LQEQHEDLHNSTRRRKSSRSSYKREMHVMDIERRRESRFQRERRERERERVEEELRRRKNLPFWFKFEKAIFWRKLAT
jgi:hypothetical protein